MGEQAWTKEPWAEDMGSSDSQPYVHRLSRVDWVRARACVNAMRGIDDPPAYVERVERLVKAADSAQAELGAALELHDFGPPLGENVKRLSDALDALADLATMSKS